MDILMQIITLVFFSLLLGGKVYGDLHKDEVVVRILGGPKVAKYLADEMGYFFKGPVRGFSNTYLLIPMELEYPSYSKRGMQISKRLVDDARVLWAEPQQIKSRQKRDYRTLLDKSDVPLLRSKRVQGNQEVIKRPPAPVYDETFNDELWTQEWYMQDTRTHPDLPKLDLNVLPVYRAGITGKGIRISILDDGIEYTHEDLKINYDPTISWDCNEDDNDPFPRYDPTHQNSHGTRCAGEVAMIANNGKCGVGIAFNAKVGGVKLLDGLVNDRIEGTALGFGHDIVDIYSASWGPNDDGKTVDGPGRLANEALVRGITEGRGGKGSIYIWASGNGGDRGDNCNCDGYLASPYTISIGSASQRGEFPWYGEACASTLAVTYSSGAYQDQMIATTDLHNQCTIKHTGTSASAPLAAGIIALALEANSKLTWRDVQHLIVWSSEVAPVADNPGWQKNAAGLWYNTRFGFGLMNAFGLVSAAVNWTTVPVKSVCTVQAYPFINSTISYQKPLVAIFETTGCKGTDKEVRYLEHVEVQTTIQYPIRGSLEIYVTSPAGTKAQILNPRKLDNSRKGFNNWTFMSVITWGELAEGVWTVTVADNVGPDSNQGSVVDISINLHGTASLPNHMKHGVRAYNHEYNRIHNRVGKAEVNKYDDMYLNYIDDLLADLNVKNDDYFDY